MSPVDPLFLELTPEDIETEYWAHHYSENNSKEDFEDEDFDLDAYLREAETGDDWETLIDDQ